MGCENAWYLIQYINNDEQLRTRNLELFFLSLPLLGNLFINLCDSRDQPSGFVAIHTSLVGLTTQRLC